MTILGLDVGGANIKAATSTGQSSSHRFALWKRPGELADFLKAHVFSQFEKPRAVALTMTGELCDCFESKREGVECIVEAVHAVAPQVDLGVYAVGGHFLNSLQAKQDFLQVAASNWHALANYSRRFLTENEQAILMDMGSTSCDIIPLNGDEVLAKGTTDTTRIQHHELVYTGAFRTPVCAVIQPIEFRGAEVTLAQEIFATMADVYLILGDLPADENETETADGRPLTIENSFRRLARAVCADLDEITTEELEQLAGQIAQAQRSLIQHAWKQVAQNKTPEAIIYSGFGHFVVSGLASGETGSRSIELACELGADLCTAAPAFAVACLLEES